MALSIHGLCIIAEPVTQEIPYKFTTILKFQVASDDGFNKTQRHYIDLFVPTEKASEIKAKITKGTICEITHGVWAEVTGKNYDETKGPRYSKVELKVDWKNFKFLKPCVYYEDIIGITTTEETIKD